ncbi:hypothetical protein FACS1894153_1350 [Bacteroidia bacterium]|nr:hypothetical protein FACS1894153_1350 [Bacteroidia bacterium]
MNNFRKIINEDFYYVGANDRRLSYFEGVYSCPKGVSYNSYIVKDKKNTLLDTVDNSVVNDFFDNVESALDGETLDYLIINHMEPDHSSAISEVLRRYPNITLVSTQRVVDMLANFQRNLKVPNVQIVKEGDVLETGKYKFTFAAAPMVHWPEVIVTYEMTTGTLFSADAFGTFTALSGNLYADEYNFETEWLSEARRYYTNIVGKYGQQVNALLKKAASLDIKTICPLHGPIWRKDISWFIEKYEKWANYEPEDNAFLIVYGSIYGGTKSAAEHIAAILADKGVRNITIYDVSVVPVSNIVSECFRVSHIIFASSTYNAGIFTPMENVLLDLKYHNFQNRTIGIIENGSWAPTSGKLMTELLTTMKNMNICEPLISLRSTPSNEQHQQLEHLTNAMLETYKGHINNNILSNDNNISSSAHPTNSVIDNIAMQKISYGLFVLSTNGGGCIINTVMQVTDTPQRIAISVNKANLTCELVQKNKMFNLSILNTDTPFDVFKHFGFQSSRDIDKFATWQYTAKTSNGIDYLTKYANSVISAKVMSEEDCGTHIIFIGEVTEAFLLEDIPSATYSYYFEHIKPKPIKPAEPKKGYICKICGYFHEGEELPDDFICPLCKHGIEAFEKVD